MAIVQVGQSESARYAQEREDDVFQSGWYRGILRIFAPG